MVTVTRMDEISTVVTTAGLCGVNIWVNVNLGILSSMGATCDGLLDGSIVLVAVRDVEVEDSALEVNNVLMMA